MDLKKILFTLIIGALFSIQPGLMANSFAGSHDHGAPDHAEEEIEKGPNNGRMLRQGKFAIELAIFENGTPPEFRVFGTVADEAIVADQLSVSIKLERLGKVVDEISFFAEGDYLRGDMEVYEPHSFVVNLSARYKGKNYQWSYENFEGRTHIERQMAEAMGIETGFVAAQSMAETVAVFGKLTLPDSANRHISARFPGEVKSLNVELGSQVKQGQLLMTIEGNESLQTYKVLAPINGVISKQDVGVGEQTGDRNLLTITDNSKLFAELSIFPKDQSKVQLGDKVLFAVTGSEDWFTGSLYDSLIKVNAQQARIYRVAVDNSLGHLAVGQFLEANIIVDTYDVPKAVKRDALQSFRDFTVVYAKVDDDYEVRMLELGRSAGEWVEVLGGIEVGTEYVIANSYIIKADIEKSGAAHDH